MSLPVGVSLRRGGGLLSMVAITFSLLPVLPARADAVRDAQWHLPFLHIAEAQKISQGEGVTVGVIDTGVLGTHPDLQDNVLPGIDLYSVGGDGRTATDGHGTAMAGLIAAHGRGGAGVLGVAPKAKILPVAVGPFELAAGVYLDSGITWAVQHGARILCIALGSSRNADAVRQAIQAASAADVLVVAAVGNRPAETVVDYPAAYSGVIAVAGVDQTGNHAAVSVTGDKVVLSAPAVDVVSTNNDGKYRKGTGTSDATAIIAGVAALVRAKYPQLSAPEVYHRLTATAIDKGPPGRDNEYGYGIVDPVAALTRDVPPIEASGPSNSNRPSTGSPQTGTASASTATPADRPDRTMGILGIVGLAGLFVAAAVGAVVALRRRHRS